MIDLECEINMFLPYGYVIGSIVQLVFLVFEVSWFFLGGGVKKRPL